jgi:phosphoribosylformylglycinamidine synthase
MKFRAEIDVMPLDELLDPEGKAVTNGLHDLSLQAIEQVRVGKHMTLSLEAEDKAEAESMVEKACKELLVNPVIERYQYHVLEV